MLVLSWNPSLTCFSDASIEAFGQGWEDMGGDQARIRASSGTISNKYSETLTPTLKNPEFRTLYQLSVMAYFTDSEVTAYGLDNFSDYQATCSYNASDDEYNAWSGLWIK